MKRTTILLLIGVVCVGASWAAYQAIAPEGPPLSKFAPGGALLYLQTNDFSSLLADWNKSPEKQSWVKSSNYEVFSRSKLFLRLKDASAQFSAAAGLPSDMKLLEQVAGSQSAIAIYDIGKLQFLYVTKLSSTNSVHTTLWQTRSKFETRDAGGIPFYYRKDAESEREVAFAINGDYLLLATREDLMAGALELIAGGKGNSIEGEAWWSQATAAAGAAGELRLVLNLDKIVPSPYFRSYWVQKNVTDMKQYSAAVSDLVRSGREYREERVLLKRSGGETKVTPDADAAAVADLARLAPDAAGFYAAKASPSAEDCFAVLETKILAPHLGQAAPQQLAPTVAFSNGTTGEITDLETRIDQSPVQSVSSDDVSIPVKELFSKNPVRASLEIQSTEVGKDGVFVRLHSVVALAGEADWNEASVRAALAGFVRPSLTTGRLGVEWQAGSGYQELNGLWTLAVAVRGKYLIVSDNREFLGSALGKMKQKSLLKPASYIAGFQHEKERENFTRLTGLLDTSGETGNPGGRAERMPEFFSGNMASLSSTLAGVASEKIVVRESGDKVMQTVTYRWDR